MRADIVAGELFPDYDLTDHTGKHRAIHTQTNFDEKVGSPKAYQPFHH